MKEKILETSSRLFFKSITIAGTATSVYMLGNYIKTDPSLTNIYIALGIALGAIITFYVYPNFSKSKDTVGLLVAIVMVSLISYLPSSAIIYKWAESKVIADITVPKGNAKIYNKAFTQYTKLKTQRAEYIQEPLLAKAEAQSKKARLEAYQRDLKAYNKRKNNYINSCNAKWTLPTYKTKNKICRVGFTEKAPILGESITTDYKQFDIEYNKRKKSDYNLAKISTQKEIMAKNDPKPYQIAVAKAKSKLPSFYIVALLTLLLGIIIESLGELPYFFMLRREAIMKKPTPAPITKPVALLAPINNTKLASLKTSQKTSQKTSSELELTELNLLKERYKGVGVGDRLVSKSKLPFKSSNQLNQMVSDLNKKLKEIGAVEGTTHLKATKTYQEVLRNVKTAS